MSDDYSFTIRGRGGVACTLHPVDGTTYRASSVGHARCCASDEAGGIVFVCFEDTVVVHLGDKLSDLHPLLPPHTIDQITLDPKSNDFFIHTL